MTKLQWHGREDTLELPGFLIKGALVYSGEGKHHREGSAVLLGLPVEPPHLIPRNRAGLRYYPLMNLDYQDMGAAERGRYLRWLQEGRPPGGDEGHRLLFLRGLERRTLKDEADIPELWLEVWRLWKTSEPGHYLFRPAARNLLWFLLTRAGDSVGREQAESLGNDLSRLNPWDTEGERYLSLLVRWSVENRGGLPGWLAFHVARILPEAGNTVAVTRTAPELRALFEEGFANRWGEVLPLDLPPASRRRMTYNPVNPEVGATVLTWRDPLKVAGVWSETETQLSELYNACQKSLRPLALYLGRFGSARGTVTAWEATPESLRAGPHPAAAKLEAALAEVPDKSALIAVQLASLAGILEVTPRPHLSLPQSVRLADSLQQCGFVVEPDARLSGRAYRWSDTLALFRPPAEGSRSLAEGTPAPTDAAPPAPPSPTKARERYSAWSFWLAVALYAANKGTRLKSETVSFIGEHILGLFHLDALERRRFRALAGLWMQSELELSSLRIPDKFTLADREAVSRFVVEVVRRDGVLNAERETAMRQVWKRLYLDPREITRETEQLSRAGVVYLGEHKSRGPGEAIPPPPPPAGQPLQLDRELLSSLLSETRHVQAALAAAMTEAADNEEAADGEPALQESAARPLPPAEAPETPSSSATARLGPAASPASPTAGSTSYPGLEPRLAPLLERLRQQPQWPLAEAQEVARGLGTMLSGAVEAINDWSFEELGGQLLWEEDGEHLSVELALLS